ncbi:sulfatase-like hydrolase/transferase [Natronomonas halophila]|uniref:sulfatase-like hydrolase/transferase n=1 Tax=Natronomonas halophila TaxID=2747817 RepID=UPI0015B61405|nr:sulfatase-like hydrolase/transferase [Natronomonas halophila]QLD86840.1 sulfatase-like hydrolase/transferase [Natronomonas halophila]
MQNLLWISIDSFRLDFTSLSGNEGDTPVLSRLAERGRSFSNCFSTGIKTPTSSASILTGTYPTYHGIYGPPDEFLPEIDESITTVAERLRQVGYRTSGVSRNIWISEKSGFDRGFDEFVWFEQSPKEFYSKLTIWEKLKYPVSMVTNRLKFGKNASFYSTAPLVADRVSRHVTGLERRDEPYFLFAHFNETHRPYLPPRQFLSDSIEIDEVVSESMDFHERLYEIIGQGEQDTIDTDLIQMLYEAELRHVDACLERVFDAVDFDDTVVVVTGDHGEFLGEYGLFGHQLFAFDEVINVPLVVTGLDIEGDPDQYVQHPDVLRTFFAANDIEFEQAQGIDLREESRTDAVTCWHSSTKFFTEHNSSFNDDGSYFDGYVLGLRAPDGHYMRSRDEDREMLFRPGTNTPLADEAVRDRLSSRLNAFRDETERDTTVSKAQDSDAEERLRDLGYLG